MARTWSPPQRSKTAGSRPDRAHRCRLTIDRSRRSYGPAASVALRLRLRPTNASTMRWHTSTAPPRCAPPQRRHWHEEPASARTTRMCCWPLTRRLGMPSRYVSGQMLGFGGSHAWVEVMVPDGARPCSRAVARPHARSRDRVRIRHRRGGSRLRGCRSALRNVPRPVRRVPSSRPSGCFMTALGPDDGADADLRADRLSPDPLALGVSRRPARSTDSGSPAGGARVRPSLRRSLARPARSRGCAAARERRAAGCRPHHRSRTRGSTPSPSAGPAVP